MGAVSFRFRCWTRGGSCGWALSGQNDWSCTWGPCTYGSRALFLGLNSMTLRPMAHLCWYCHVSVACNLHVHDGDNSFTLRTEASGLLLITWPSHRVREYTRCDTFFSLFQKCPEKIFNLDGLRWSVYGYYSHHEQWDWQIKGAILSRRTK